MRIDMTKKGDRGKTGLLVFSSPAATWQEPLLLFIPIDRVIVFLFRQCLHDLTAKRRRLWQAIEIAARMRAHLADRRILSFLKDKTVEMLPRHSKAHFPGGRIHDLSRLQIRIDGFEDPRISPRRAADRDRGTACLIHKALR